METPSLEDIIKASGLHKSRVFNVYIFGSRVYNNHNSDSDWDIIMVANNSVESIEIRRGLFNIHVYTPDKFKKDLEWHRINNLECIFAPDCVILKQDINYKKDFVMNLSKLRHAISHISSNSWVKAKKKIEIGEYYIGIKSLFHSMRIPLFAKQLVDKEVIDFESANYLWDKIGYNLGYRFTWEELNNEFKATYNRIMSEFRSVASK